MQTGYGIPYRLQEDVRKAAITESDTLVFLSAMVEFIKQRKRLFQEWMVENDLTVNQVAKEAGVNRQTIYTWVREGKKPLGHALEGRIANRYDLPIEAIFGPPPEYETLEIEPNFVAQWRERDKMTRRELAKKLRISETALELLEQGQMPLSNKWAQRLAEIFGTMTGFVFHDPATIDDEMLRAIGVSKDLTDVAKGALNAFRHRAAG